MHNYISFLSSLKRLNFCPLFIICLIFWPVLYGCQTPLNSSSSLIPEEKINLEQKLWRHEYLTLEGKKFYPADLQARIVLINFWASWCLPCMQEIPGLIQLAKKFPRKDLSIISINVDTENQLLNLMKTHRKFKITDEFFHVADRETRLADSVPFSTIPVTIVFKQGEAIAVFHNPVDFESENFLRLIR